MSTPSLVLSDEETHWAHKCAEVLKEFLREQQKKFIRAHKSKPVLQTYSSDCTPLRTRSISRAVWGSLHATRSGRTCREWLAQRCFLLSASGDVCTLMVEPKLLHDKTAWTHYQAQIEFDNMARQNFESIAIHHHVWDRAIVRPCERHQLQRHAAYDSMLEDELDAGEAMLSKLLSWVTVVGCVAHDLSNSLRWSITSFLDDTEKMRACWVVMESLRNSFDQLLRQLPSWLGSVVVYEDHDDPRALADLWALLGLPEEWVVLFVHTQIRWESGRLKVSQALMYDTKTPQLLTTCLTKLWRFRTWSGTRWCVVGQSCRCIVGSVFVGLRSLVDHILAAADESKYYIAGFNRLDETILRMCAVVSASSQVSEVTLAFILKDDRLAKHIDEVDRLRRLEVDVALGLDDSVLELLGGVAGVSSLELKGDIHDSVLIQSGYLEYKIRDIRGLPWTLAKGDIAANLRDLVEGPVPAEATSQKIHQLASMGYSMHELEAGVRLLGEAPFSALTTEQAHSFAANLMKMHPKYTRSTMTARAMVQQCACLFRPDPLLKKINTSKKRLCRLRRRRPGRITGRHAFVSSLFAEAKRWTKGLRPLRMDFAKGVMKQHGKKWASMHREHKMDFHTLAAHLQEERRVRLATRILTEQGRLQKLRQQLRDECLQPSGSPLRLSSCRFTACQQVDFEAMLSARLWSRAHLAELREKANEPIQQPIDPIKATLDSMAIPVTTAGAEVPAWARWMAHHRDFFKSGVARMKVGEGAMSSARSRTIASTEARRITASGGDS